VNSLALNAASVAFIAISLAAFIAQSTALAKLITQSSTSGARRQGLVRTVSCRVFAAGLYVMLGVEALLVPPEVAAVTAFWCFGATQCLWLASSAMDVRLSRRLNTANENHGRHRQNSIGRIGKGAALL
jgi:hypothetical protein